MTLNVSFSHSISDTYLRIYHIICGYFLDINKQQVLEHSVFDQHEKIGANNNEYIAIIKALFDGKIKFTNTKKQALINSGVIMHSLAFQQYFKQKMHPSLDIEEWIIEEKQRMIKTQQKYKGIGDFILDKLRNKLQQIITIQNDHPQTNYLVPQQQPQFNHNEQQQPQYLPTLNSNGGSPYSGTHGATHSVSGQLQNKYNQFLINYICFNYHIYSETRYCPWTRSNSSKGVRMPQYSNTNQARTNGTAKAESHSNVWNPTNQLNVVQANSNEVNVPINIICLDNVNINDYNNQSTYIFVITSSPNTHQSISYGSPSVNYY